MPFSDPEARRLYQRELMRKRRGESKGKKGSNGTNAGTNKGSNTVSPVRPSGLPKRAEQCPNGCGYKTRDHEKLQRHLKNYCPSRNAGSGTNTRDMDHKSDVSPSSSPSPGNLLRAKGEYTGGELRGKCPICGTINVMDPERSFRPLSSSSKCDHFQQLEAPGKPSDFLFKKMAGLTGLTGRTNGANTSTVGPDEKISYDYSKRIMKIYERNMQGQWRYSGRYIRKDQEYRGIIYSWHDGSGQESREEGEP